MLSINIHIKMILVRNNNCFCVGFIITLVSHSCGCVFVCVCVNQMNFYRLIISQHVIIVIESQYIHFLTPKYVCALSFYCAQNSVSLTLFKCYFQWCFMSHGARSPAILFYLFYFLLGKSLFPSPSAAFSLFAFFYSILLLSFLRLLYFAFLDLLPTSSSVAHILPTAKNSQISSRSNVVHLNRFGAIIMIFSGYLGDEELDVLTTTLNQLALSAQLRCLDT